jgi:hypothetical protein
LWIARCVAPVGVDDVEIAQDDIVEAAGDGCVANMITVISSDEP